MRQAALPDTVTFALALDKTAPPSDGRRDPVPPAAAALAEASAAVRLDPTRRELIPESPPRRDRWIEGPIGSLLLHLLPLLALVAWLRPPLEMPKPIPVQLVIEQPKEPPLPPAATPPDKPPHGRFASDDVAETQGPKTEPAPGAAQPQAESRAPEPAEKATLPTETPPAETPPTETPTEATAATEPAKPEPSPAAAQAAEPQPPAALAEPVQPEPRPKPTPPKRHAAARVPDALAGSWPLPLEPNEARRSAALVGPNATRDEYCAYALQLTLRHLDLLPASMIGSRRGTTVVSIRVLDDGTIRDVAVARSSGYPDIDARVEQMVFAVGKFPPLPQWLPGPWMDFRFQLHFPR